MSLTTVTLKSNVFLTLDDAKDWLGIALLDTRFDRKLTMVINATVDQVEKYIEGPVLTRRYVATMDGDSSNVIVPEFYPVRSLEEIKIDYNRQFTSPPLLPSDVIIRGTPEMNNVAGDFTVNIKGSDIVLRDDNNTSLLGRIFAGSVLGSIRVTYTAGWGADQASLPGELVMATFLLMEYYWDLKQQKYMNSKSKTNGDQSYDRELGIPQEIRDILDAYKDHSLGTAHVPQRNVFPT